MKSWYLRKLIGHCQIFFINGYWGMEIFVSLLINIKQIIDCLVLKSDFLSLSPFLSFSLLFPLPSLVFFIRYRSKSFYSGISPLISTMLTLRRIWHDVSDTESIAINLKIWAFYIKISVHYWYLSPSIHFVTRGLISAFLCTHHTVIFKILISKY